MHPRYISSDVSASSYIRGDSLFIFNLSNFVRNQSLSLWMSQFSTFAHVVKLSPAPEYL